MSYPPSHPVFVPPIHIITPPVFIPPGEPPCDDIPDNDIPDCDEPMDPEDPPTDVPEPGVWILMLTGILVYIAMDRREAATVHIRK